MHAYFEKSSFDTLQMVINGGTAISVDLSGYYNAWLNLVISWNGNRNFSWIVLDIEGLSVDSGTGRTSFTDAASEVLQVGSGFLGFIRGVVVVQSVLASEVQFATEADYTGAEFFGASFAYAHWSGSRYFTTYGSEGGSVSAVTNSDAVEFDTIYFKETETDVSGTFDDTSVVFDGLACEETKKSLYFSDTSHKV